ncbi:OLC1v1033228C1 [Oldenlandia corymbosa var. corymbosa]|uniref:OLC1v1033228C1 n=1 Tax=Oldenlandia corymbosa var. corymbosa TaxID=529605 RepID=A0AAV1CMX9_OLDCO|nr:OLC1v1033228C1 [Oldenlandia corymbosa var. corymbosa]
MPPIALAAGSKAVCPSGVATAYFSFNRRQNTIRHHFLHFASSIRTTPRTSPPSSATKTKFSLRKRNKKRTILCAHPTQKLTSFTGEELETKGKVVVEGEGEGKAVTEIRDTESEEFLKAVDLSAVSSQKLTLPIGEELDSMGNNVIEDGEREKGDAELSDTEAKDAVDPLALLPGLPSVPSKSSRKAGVIFVLEKASLVPAYVGRTYEILNPDKHAEFLRKKKLNPYDYRPDIIHEILVDIMGSRLNMAGGVQAVYVKTDLGQLIKIDPHVKIPPTLGKFCAMMCQLLQKFSIKASGKGKKLLKLIENPLVQHLPMNSKRIGLSKSSPKAVKLQDYVCSIDSDVTPVFVIGAMAHGKIECDYIEDLISVSALPLSAGVCIRRICYELERRWGIL